jgi:hypothetical protein
MPNTREKLIRILASKPELLQNLNIHISKLFKLSDYLIANGVTFATDNNVGHKWIPVTERLPGEGDVVLVYDKYRCLYIGRHLYDEVFNAVGRNFNTSAVAWMPLPEPPKGE